jgi:hypothetical protein
MSLQIEVIVAGQPTVIEVANVGPQGPPGADGDGTAYYGQISTQTPQTVVITDAGVYVPMDISGTVDTANSFGLIASTTRSFGLKNNTGSSQLLTVIATADVQVGNNRSTGWRLAVNSVPIAETTCSATTGTANFAKVLTQWIVEVPDGGEISCYLANLTDTNDITVVRSKIVAFTAGRQGEEGPAGPTGATGATGPTGATGATEQPDHKGRPGLRDQRGCKDRRD